MPKGKVPGEWYAPTQPFPVKPARPLSRTDFVKERDLVRPEDTSAQHVAECEALWEKSGGFANAGPYTPFGFHEEGAPPKSTIQFPGGTGGVNWGGAAADPTTGYVYVNAHDTSLVGWIEFKRPGQNYGNGTAGPTVTAGGVVFVGATTDRRLRLRCQDRQGAVVGSPGRPGERQPDDLPRQERQAVRGRGRYRLVGGLRVAIAQ